MYFKVRAEEEQSPKTMSSLITSLPHEIIIDIVARVPRSDYPTISLVSKSFRSLVVSPELYTRRSLLGCTEHCLYAIIHNFDTKEGRLYILRRKVNSNRLVTIPSFPLMPFHGSYVVVGSKIYVLDFFSSVSIDCKSHTVQPISDIPKPMTNNEVAEIIHGNKLRAYDPKQRCWRVVNGLEELLPKMINSWYSKTVSYDGKLALFFHKHSYAPKKRMEIWCAEIALEKRQGGEIWGKVQWCDVVLDDGRFYMKKCLAVTV